MTKTSNKTNLISKLADKIGLFVYQLSPERTKRKIDSLLLIPKLKDQFKFKIPGGLKQQDIKTRDGNVHAYMTGSGPVILFVHGWNGGAYQFFPLMRGIAQCGFTAMSFDHLGHGLSDAKAATLHQFISTTNDVINYARKSAKEGVYALVGHGTGCIAIANCRGGYLKNLPLFLISPIFNYKLYFLKRLVQLKYHPELLKQYASNFSKFYKDDFEKLELGKHLPKYADVSLIAHDESDKDSPVIDSINYCKQYPITKLLLTKGFDHQRIINSESVWQELKSHVNYEDTTINFIEQLKNQ